ncbi:hypothetical protein HPB52_024813 [Rhipicephalus sanguineus]|uniref:Nuclease HARBI1 n=1 Tax=Rhipicephalus sanguineus TaxID=34632 RepID=A0A9D4YRP9_RHISA|nr:hypothetical protein HPB52_024813 [Rhipicephalus sanguineus]
MDRMVKSAKSYVVRREVGGVMDEFYKIGQFPDVSGCIDCTHVPIRSPGGDDAEVYRNRKGQGLPTTAEFFDSSRARVMYETDAITGIPLGDMSYACRSYLMTPLKDPQRGRARYRQATPGCTECSAAYIGTTKRTASDGNPRHRRL